MARIDSLANFLEDVATKIRSKTGSQSTITPANYDTEIEKISFKGKAIICFNVNVNASINLKQDSTTRTVDLNNLDTSNFTTMQQMFFNLNALEELDVSNFDTSNVTSMYSMFYGCKALTELDLSNFNTNNVTNMQQMFNNCNSLTRVNLSSFNTSNVPSFNTMFRRCDALETIIFGNDFTFSGATSVNSFTNMFQYCTKLDNSTLNKILYLCTTATSYLGTKTLAQLGINNTFDNFANIPNLSNYQAFTNAGWTIS